ncbi:MAG: hypothetical protein A2138_12100 [Deltaproteobacteria bacterium RBG_16_71_12]|nr:MAG: hypothetical protein A2138_12100 [Deltaproteobacteria bacterium RBG_16_71_12]
MRVGAVVVLGLLVAECVPEIVVEDAGCPCDTGNVCCDDVCVRGDRCPECEVEQSGLDASPPCDCDSFLPMCVGARWDYDEFEPSTEAPLGSKTQVLIDFKDPGDPSFDKTSFEAFVSCRTSDDSLRTAWQTVEGARTLWQMDQWFGLERTLTKTAYYVPSRLRLDESRATPGDAWTESNTLYTIVAPGIDAQPCNDGNPPAPLADVEGGYQCATELEQWSVLSLAEATTYGADLAGYQPQDVLCHAVERGEVKIYCFARGVGKFFELEVGAKRELLVDHYVPGCGPSP